MGLQSCQKTSAAFLVWKREAKIPLEFAYDKQEQLSGIIRLAKIFNKHVFMGQMISIAYIQQHAYDQ